ncbi:pyridoxal phosphate-dependent aminotransferase [Oleidesulfovibrio sp.]|uniref:pyridoxal phosphate-dependent aminotransferase n=1 Tax=Oleidesulfovibrio sp. TaxID=2909707 RepID=UPI003A8BD5AD
MTETARTQGIKPFYAMDVLERAQELERQGVKIIHLEVGEPDFDVPPAVKDAVCSAMDNGHTHYTNSMGMPELRQAIADDYHKKYGVVVSPERIAVTNGTSPAMFMLFAALLEQGDEVIISDPHYACYPSFITFAGGEPVKVPVLEEDGFQYRVDAIKKKLTSRTRAIFINSPSNPTGNQLPAERMARIAALGLPVISDEIYHGLEYGEKEHTILEFTDNAFVFNGFSKLYAMTGLRLGYLISPGAYVPVMRKLCQNFFISPNAVSQMAGIAALTQCEHDVNRMRIIYDERRKFMIRRLREIGFGITVEPTGAFYVLANARFLSDDSYKLAFEILENAHIGVTPGIDFGQGAEGYIRFSYANSLENIHEAMNRLELFVKERQQTEGCKAFAV